MCTNVSNYLIMEKHLAAIIIFNLFQFNRTTVGLAICTIERLPHISVTVRVSVSTETQKLRIYCFLYESYTFCGLIASFGSLTNRIVS